MCSLGFQGCGRGVAVHVSSSYLLPRLEGSFLSPLPFMSVACYHILILCIHLRSLLLPL